MLSLILIYISQCRDVITVLLLFSYSDIAVIYVAGQRMIWRCNAACFNAFVDYMPELGDWMLIHCDLRDLSLVKVPHNCEIAADIMRNYKLSTLIHIQFVDLCFRDLHLQFESSSPPNHGKECFGQLLK